MINFITNIRKNIAFDIFVFNFSEFCGNFKKRKTINKILIINNYISNNDTKIRITIKLFNKYNK